MAQRLGHHACYLGCIRGFKVRVKTSFAESSLAWQGFAVVGKDC
jgi:hypothetical protein